MLTFAFLSAENKINSASFPSGEKVLVEPELGAGNMVKDMA